jgi:hypothetical protein
LSFGNVSRLSSLSILERGGSGKPFLYHLSFLLHRLHHEKKVRATLSMLKHYSPGDAVVLKD